MTPIKKKVVNNDYKKTQRKPDNAIMNRLIDQESNIFHHPVINKLKVV